MIRLIAKRDVPGFTLSNEEGEELTISLKAGSVILAHDVLDIYEDEMEVELFPDYPVFVSVEDFELAD